MTERNAFNWVCQSSAGRLIALLLCLIQPSRRQRVFDRRVASSLKLQGSLVSGLSCLVLALATVDAASAAPKRVLILHSFGRGFSPIGIVATSFQTDLAEHWPEPIEFHEASLEIPRIASGEPAEALVPYVRGLFGENEPDLIVPFGA